ncbi:phosphate acyltransferase PlsX [Oceanicoccus sp. KOV_DT_Chl]|uniref:phosphate acyltransferase PlsX n=1 Tax=Oceanicoccus sp. KOV_DT_Chl TaxID=1904639 RepID=UPI000C7A705D|nr:phosphate acyltransferase PlsX [Oceanicoccus sp. KOV_DT_Chl]
MASRIRIAIDCMGGDLGLRVSIPAAIQAQSLFPDLDITLVGDESAIASVLGQANSSFTILHAPDVVEMSDKPSHALRRKPQSSMRMAIDLLAQSQVDAVVSAGNTGALMAIGCLVLKTLPGIERPAICSALPSPLGHCHLLDLGANVDSSAEQLEQFAIMGAALSSVVDGIDAPRIALLNIGEEAIKGNEQVQQAGKLIDVNAGLNYVGFVEGDALFKGVADVVVADGFVGNVALKVCEGTAFHIADVVKQYFNQSYVSRLAGLIASPVLKRIFHHLDPEQYNGASFLGLQGVVVKSHGASTELGFVNAIARARLEVKSNLIAVLSERLAQLHNIDK